MWHVPGSIDLFVTPAITRYLLRVQALVGGGTNTSSWLPVPPGQDTVNGFTFTHTVSSLQPNTEYAFYITASNEVIGGASSIYHTGRGPESAPAYQRMGLSVPAPLAINTATDVTELTNTSLVVTFPTANGYGLPILGYALDLCLVAQGTSGGALTLHH